MEEVFLTPAIPEDLWPAFLAAARDDPLLPEKDIKKRYSTKYLRCKQKESDVEIGLLLVGSMQAEVDYGCEDTLNFIGKLNHAVVKARSNIIDSVSSSNGSLQTFFFAIVHHF